MIKYSKKGFSLIDVIFAIGIILVGLISILGLLRYVIIAGRVSNDKFIATNLAEEGVEIIRAIRDSNWLAGGNWDDNLPSAAEYKRVDYRQNILLNDDPNAYLNIDSSGFYSYDAGTPTKFQRRIYFDPTVQCTPAGDVGQCIHVVSEVKWENYTLVIEDRLYNWRP